jgi:Domain of unknown function (DUF4174)
MGKTGMLKVFFLFCLSLVLSYGAVWAEKSMDVVDLGQYRWKNRLLFLFSPSPEVPAFQTFMGELNRNSEGVRDRDLLVFRVLEQGPSFLASQEITPQGAEGLRRRLGVDRGAFTVVLVGKDGGVKLQRPGPVALSDIFGLIDSMPMRQREMRQK